jgi:FeS assembly protein IscX
VEQKLRQGSRPLRPSAIWREALAGSLKPVFTRRHSPLKNQQRNFQRRRKNIKGAFNTMPPSFDWNDLEDLAISLTDKYPGVDPLTVRFTDLHKWIIELPLFTGDPNASNEAKLEAIQMAWHEEFQDRQS